MMSRSVSMVVLVLTTMLGTVAASLAQDDGAASKVAQESVPRTAASDIDAARSERAPVAVDGRVLFHVSAVPGMAAAERAGIMQQNVEEIAADQSVAADSLHLVEMPDRTRIYAGDRAVVGFLDTDAAAEHVSRQFMAERALMGIREAIASYRNDRNPRVLLINTGRALFATIVLAILLFLMRRLFRKLDGLAERRLKSHIEQLEAQSNRVIQAQPLWKALQSLLKGLNGLAVLVLGYFYLSRVLSFYPWTRPLAVRLLAIVLDPLRAMGAGLLDSLPGLAFIAVLAIVTRYVLRVTRLYFDSIDRGALTLAGFDRELALPTYRLMRLAAVSFAVVVAYPYIPGSSSEAFKGVTLLLGVMVSLGSSSVIGNLMAGYALIYRRPFHVGDRVSIEGVTGDVIQRRLMVTHLRTVKNEEIVMPNSKIMDSPIINYSTYARTGGLILHTTVGIGYETPWRQVEAILLLAAERTPGLLKEPAPFVLQQSLGDFDVTYELNAYCDDPKRMPLLYTAMHQNALDLFNEHGVQIMTPAYEGDPETPKVVPKDQWYQAPARGTQDAGK